MYRSFFFYLIYAAILILAGCQDSDRDSSNIADKPEITWWSTNRADSFGIPMDELPVFQALQERTGVKISFIHPPVGQYDLRFRMMLSSGDLPDVISHDFVADYPQGIPGAVNDGVILPIDEALLEHAPNLRDFLEGNPDIAEALSLPQGGICCFPSLNGDTRTSTYMGPFVRDDLLKRHNLDPPETIAEWETVLSRFADDPAIDIPLTFYGGKLRDTAFLAGTFDAYWSFFVTDGVYAYGPAEPAFREFVGVLHRWYRNGWIDQGVIFNSRRAYDRTVRGNTIGIYVDYVSAIMEYEEALRESTANAHLVPLSYPRRDADAPVPAGHDAGFFVPFASAYITTAAANPQQIVQVLDYLWSEEGRRLFNFGIEGVSYDMVDDRPVFRDELFQAGRSDGYSYYVQAGPYLKDAESFLQTLRLPAQRRAIELWSAGSGRDVAPPQAVHSGAAFLDIKHKLDRYTLEVVADFISGKVEDEAIEQLRNDLIKIGLADVLNE